MNKTCIVIAGPTAAGKTAIAVQLAQHFNTQIISADSRQCFRELNIGVAKPSVEELAQVHHYFINSHSIHENVTAADYEHYAFNAAGKIFRDNDVAVMVGGTGLYIKAFTEGLDKIPATDEKIREQIIHSYREKGIAWLQDQLKAEDPAFAASGEMQNPQRMMRALEVKRSTGRSISSFQLKQKPKRDFNIIQVGLELPRELLYERINSRVDKMIEAGLIDEAKSLLPFKELNALQTVGYKELFSYFEGTSTKAGAIEQIKQNTRHYAKRQMTWFRKDESVEWVAPVFEEVLENVERRTINVQRST
ncbi:MAG: tRNA (adenosine(37)-N6)-dimethylallyltransferase MiaA [Bacteroidetes bacterium]|nr:tRNA (adenosine(37)-N6)-dimethylallyltransferase MiaA [Bacteroidota bacterium]